MISIIVPAYNSEKTIIRCVNSVLSQEPLVDFELLIIDDGSNDQTYQLLKSHFSLESKVSIIKTVNQGVSMARNIGLSIAKGEFILFLDSDDILSRDFFKSILLIPDYEKQDLICGNISKKADNKEIDNVGHPKLVYAKTRKDIGSAIGNISPGLVLGKLFSKRIIDNYHLSFDTQLKLGEDLVFVYNFVFFCSCMCVSEAVFYIQYNVNMHSLSKRYVSNMEYTINKQKQCIQKAFCLFPEYKNIFFKKNLSLEISDAIFYFKNLFFSDSPLSKKEKKEKIRVFLCKEINKNILKQIDKKQKPKRMIDKIQFSIIKTNNITIIYSFYWIRERILRIVCKRNGTKK